MQRFLVDALQMYITVSVKLVDLYLQKETNTRKRPPRNCNPMQQNLNYRSCSLITVSNDIINLTITLPNE